MNLLKHNVVHIPVSFGEAVDKHTILDIKLSKIADKRRNDIEIEKYITFILSYFIFIFIY